MTGEALLLVQVRVVCGDAEAGDVDGLVRELGGTIGVDEDRGRGAVGLRAAVEQVQRMTNGRRVEDVLDGDLVLEVRVRVAGAIVVVLDGDGGEHLARRSIVVHVAGGEGRE